MNQYALWVELEVKPETAESFRAEVLRNARASVADEPGCLRFDVLEPAPPSSPQPTRFHLYEIYVDEAAFKAHLATPHFHRFDQVTASWIAKKAVSFAQVTQNAK
jgi:autoinducer 2-degrading protein